MKCQTNQEIACSLRNNFRVSVIPCVMEVEHWMDLGANSVTQPNQTPNAMMKRVTVGLCEMSFIVERETAQTDG